MKAEPLAPRILRLELGGDSGYTSSVQLSDGRVLTAYYAKGTPTHGSYHMGTVIWDPAKTHSE